MTTAALSAQELRELAVKTLEGEEDVPETYLTDLAQHCSQFPQNANFLLEPQPGKGYGTLTCMEQCMVDIDLTPRAGPDDGKKCGIGSLQAWQTHTRDPKHQTARLQRLKVEAEEKAKVAAKHPPKPLTITNRNNSLAPFSSTPKAKSTSPVPRASTPRAVPIPSSSKTHRKRASSEADTSDDLLMDEDDSDEEGLEPRANYRKRQKGPIVNESDDSDFEREDFDAAALGVASSGSSKNLDEFIAQSMAGTEWEGNVSVALAREFLGLANPEEKLATTNIDPMPHQCIGLKWLMEHEDSRHCGGILADEMGLGKTIQMISLMVMHMSDNPKRKTNLIVMPVALLQQWEDEIRQWTDDGLFKVLIYHGNKKPKSRKTLREYDIILTSYGTVSHEWVDPKKEAEWNKEEGILFGMTFHRIILDEGHYIRNRTTRGSKACADLRGDYRWILTGSPLVNYATDAYAYFRFIRKINPWCFWPEFNDRIGKVEKKKPDLAGERLQTIFKTCLLRRTKESKIDDKLILQLKPLHNDIVLGDFSEEERDIYTILQHNAQVKFNKFLKQGTVLKNYSHVLLLLLRLRMICDHPALAISEDGTDPFAEDPETVQAKEDARAELARARNTLGALFVGKQRKTVLERQVAMSLSEKYHYENANSQVDMECPICMDPLIETARVTACGHTTCHDCLTNLFTAPLNANGMLEHEDNEHANQNARPCPICRQMVELHECFTAAAFYPSDEEFENAREAERLRLGLEDDDDKAKKKAKSKATTSKSKTIITLDSDDDLPDLDASFNIKPKVKKETVSKAEKSSAKKPAAKGKAAAKKGKGKGRAKIVETTEEESEVSETESLDGFIVDDDDEGGKKGKGKGKAKAKSKGKGKSRQREPSESYSEAEEDGTDGVALRMKYDPTLKASTKEMPIMSKYVPSTKMNMTVDRLKEIFAEDADAKVIILSQWTSMLYLMADVLSDNEYQFTYYIGSMSRTERDEACRTFRLNKKIKIMLMSLKAGGVGLNLTKANHVISLDLAWSPAVEAQAHARCHRIGQSKEVFVKRLVINDTVEQRMLALQERKQMVADCSLGEGTGKKLGRLTINDFVNLFGMGAEAAREKLPELPPLVERPPGIRGFPGHNE